MPSEVQRPITAVGYGVGAMLIVLPVAELAMRFFPFQPGLINWRFGAVGLLSNAIVLPVVGMAMIAWTANVLGRRGPVVAMSVASGVGAVVLVGACLLFVLDAVQLRRSVNPSMLRSYDVAAAKALLALGFGAAMWLWIAVAGWRSTHGAAAKQAAREQAREGSRLIRPRGAATAGHAE